MVLANKKRGPKTAPPPPPAPLPAQGIGGKKRTPQSAFDPAAGGNIYEPEKVVARRPSQIGQGRHAEARSIRSLQHQVDGDLLMLARERC